METGHFTPMPDDRRTRFLEEIDALELELNRELMAGPEPDVITFGSDTPPSHFAGMPVAHHVEHGGQAYPVHAVDPRANGGRGDYVVQTPNGLARIHR
jgi:hypothetical protein